MILLEIDFSEAFSSLKESDALIRKLSEAPTQMSGAI